jgi:predicted RNA methylase
MATLKDLEYSLSRLTKTLPFPNPTIALEQYPTDVHLAARLAYIACVNGDITDGQDGEDGGDDQRQTCTTLDLGCGTGILGIASLEAGSDHCTFFDVDQSALEVCMSNAELMKFVDGEDAAFISGRVNYHPGAPNPKQDKKLGKGKQAIVFQKSPPILPPDESSPEHDGVPFPNGHFTTTFTNPPFGTKNNAGIDMQFLAAAVRVSNTAVYSFHKSTTRAHILKTVTEKWGYEAKVVAEMSFDVGNTYAFHKRKSVGIEVDLIRVDCVRGKGDDSTEAATTADGEVVSGMAALNTQEGPMIDADGLALQTSGESAGGMEAAPLSIAQQMMAQMNALKAKSDAAKALKPKRLIDNRTWEGATDIGCDFCDCDLNADDVVYHNPNDEEDEDFCRHCYDDELEEDRKLGLVKTTGREVSLEYHGDESVFGFAATGNKSPTGEA